MRGLAAAHGESSLGLLRAVWTGLYMEEKDWAISRAAMERQQDARFSQRRSPHGMRRRLRAART